MIIDFHTHIYPDKLAPRTVPLLSERAGVIPSTDGTYNGLFSYMEENGIDISVVLPVVTSPRQFDSILRFASFINENSRPDARPRLISFAGVHPASPDMKEQVRLVKREGFKGIKLHPNYQGMCFDDIRFMRLIDAASQEDLIVVTHTGYDPYTPDLKVCTPDMILHVLKELHPPKLVLAHMGNNRNHEEALEKLCGQDVYFDASYSITRMDRELFVQMVKAHGAHKILYGSDSPWGNAREGVNLIQTSPAFSQEEKDQLLFKNASRLLGL